MPDHDPLAKPSGEHNVDTGEELIEWIGWDAIADKFEKARDTPPPTSAETDADLRRSINILKMATDISIEREDKRLKDGTPRVRDFNALIAAQKYANQVEEHQQDVQARKDMLEDARMSQQMTWGSDYNSMW